jgi:hypothetical protein
MLKKWQGLGSEYVICNFYLYLVRLYKHSVHGYTEVDCTTEKHVELFSDATAIDADGSP